MINNFFKLDVHAKIPVVDVSLSYICKACIKRDAMWGGMASSSALTPNTWGSRFFILVQNSDSTCFVKRWFNGCKNLSQDLRWSSADDTWDLTLLARLLAIEKIKRKRKKFAFVKDWTTIIRTHFLVKQLENHTYI